MMTRAAWALSLGAVLLGPGASTQSDLARECSVRLEGDVPQPVTIGPAQLRALPHTEVRTVGHDQDTSVYSAVPLADVLLLGGVRLEPGPKGAGVSQYVVVRAADGYRALYAVAELDSSMTERKVWFADAKDGAPLDAQEGPCRILVPSDRRHARWVRQVTTIEFHQVP